MEVQEDDIRKMNQDDPDQAATVPRFRPTSRSLPIALLRAREAVMVPIREMLRESGISEQQWRVLRVVEEAGEIEQTAIAQAASLQLPSLTRILSAMQRDGLVGRRTDPSDRRRTLVSITVAGSSLIMSHAARNAEIFARLEAAFGRDRLDSLLDLLDELHRIRI